MVAHADQRDLLEDTMYRSLCSNLWADEHAIFDEHDSDAPFCAQKVWEALLKGSPLAHARHLMI
jgi:hypothetical protein